MINVNTFAEKLPDIFKGKKEIFAVFSSYNSISDYNRGMVETGKKGLSIYVASKSEEYHDSRVLASMFDPSDSIVPATEAQKEVEECLLRENPEIFSNKELFFFVYLGLTGFEEAIGFVASLRKDFPNAYIGTLTCDCGLNFKKSELDSMVADNTINDSVVTSRCGGSRCMSEIIQKVIATWPE